MPAAPLAMHPLAITAFTATTAVGRGVASLAAARDERRSGLVPNDYTEAATGVALSTWIGRVAGLEDVRLPDEWQALDCRNHRLAWLALQQDGFVDAVRAAIARHGASRVAVLVGTSTSTIEASEAAYRHFAQTGQAPSAFDDPALHHLHATTAFVRDLLGAHGHCATVSTACSSSAKVFAQAARLIATGVVDATVVGGVDSLAAGPLFGFHALGLVSSQPCRPFDARRDGISLGEGAGFALVERSGAATDPLLVGYGESSDAHHMSSPHPDGLGARLAIEAALARAGVGHAAVDYINLHGTATPKNDAVEAAVVAALFPPTLRASSTKGTTGHTLGAAGIVEAVVTLIALRDGIAPGMRVGVSTDPLPDDACGPQIRFDDAAHPLGIALSQAFAFGGSNCVLAFSRDIDALRAARSR